MAINQSLLAYPDTAGHRAAEGLKGQYDLAIPLANGGLRLGRVFEQHSYTVKPVKLHRHGKGATWKPLVPLGDLEGKRILLLEDDMVTGRTIRKAAQELGKHSPQVIDVLLSTAITHLTVNQYKMWKGYNLPFPGLGIINPNSSREETYTFRSVGSIDETEDGIVVHGDIVLNGCGSSPSAPIVDLLKKPWLDSLSEYRVTSLSLRNKDRLTIDTKNRSYDGIRKVMSLADY